MILETARAAVMMHLARCLLFHSGSRSFVLQQLSPQVMAARLRNGQSIRCRLFVDIESFKNLFSEVKVAAEGAN